MKLRRTLEDKSEAYIADAAELMAVARECLDIAAGHNDAAKQHHRAMVEYHDQQLVECNNRADRVAKARTALQ